MKTIKIAFSSFLILMFPTLLQAQESKGVNIGAQYQVEILISLVVIVCFVALLALLVAWWGLRVFIKLKMDSEGTLATESEENTVGFWAKFWDKFNSAAPLSSEESIATNHEYDGIRELDNRLPPWWIYGFYFTILFSIVYLLHYHVLDTGLSSEEEFTVAMNEAKADVQSYLATLDNLVDETNVTFLDDPNELAEGEAIYQANCAVCHLKDGGGSVGPNFTDKYWLHGGDIKSIFKVIKQGVVAKGMISWESQLSPKQMQQVASFVYTLEGTTPENPKKPQGELFERQENTTEENLENQEQSS